MLILGIVACVFGVGFLSWVLFNLAVFALPFYAGVSAGLAVLHADGAPLSGIPHGGSSFGAIAVGLITGFVVLAAGRAVFTLAPSALVRLVVAALFALPAAFAGYHAAHGLAGLATASELARQAIGAVGSLVVGATALTRLTLDVGRPGQAGPRTQPR